ncbi:AI-2E family transporter [Silvibacterium sp.]|uniref:AI-2E family transporter n=1 Tax=Silvibacterium sp. TaxID=1964179 RepID=UPI0039E51645
MNDPRETLLANRRSNEASAQRPQSPRAHILFAFAVALALYTAWHVREELVLLYVSALFAVVLMPVVRIITNLRIGRWSPGRGMAILLLLIVVAGAATLFFAFALPPVIRDLHEFVGELPTRGPQLLDRIRKLPFAQRVDVSSLNAKLQDFASNFATYLFYSIKNWAGSLAKIVTGIILTIYFMLEGETAYRWILSFFPLEQRQRLDTTLAKAEVRMGKWLFGQGLLMLTLGVCSTITYSLLHIRYAYALGVLTGLLNIIPIAGALISICLAILVAAIDSWGHVLGVAIFYAIYSQVETSFLTPRIMRTSVDLAGLAVIVALLLGSALAGIVGAMVAVPTAVLVAVLLNEYAVKPDAVIAQPGSTN